MELPESAYGPLAHHSRAGNRRMAQSGILQATFARRDHTGTTPSRHEGTKPHSYIPG
jgi:hypothetical protein